MSDLLTPAELAAIAEREAKAMKGPWYWRCGAKHPTTLYGSRTNIVMDVTGMRGATLRFWVKGVMHKASDFFAPRKGQEHNASFMSDLDHPDAQFIAHARTDIPTLLRHIAALEARTPAPATDVDALLAEADEAARKTTYGPWWSVGPKLIAALRESRAREVAAEKKYQRLFEPWDEVNGWCEHNHQFSYRLDDEDNSDGCMQCERDAAIARAEKAEAERDAALRQRDNNRQQLSAAYARQKDIEADLAAARAELGALGPVEYEASSGYGWGHVTESTRARCQGLPGWEFRAIRVVKEAQ